MKLIPLVLAIALVVGPFLWVALSITTKAIASISARRRKREIKE